MSRDFHYRCATCEPDGNPSSGSRLWDWCDLNWRQDQLVALLPHFPLFASVAAAGFGIDHASLGIGSGPQGDSVGDYARAHLGHVIEVWDEYGHKFLGYDAEGKEIGR